MSLLQRVVTCPDCGREQRRPNLVPLLLVPPLLGVGAWLAGRMIGERLGPGYFIALVTVPFIVFILYLWSLVSSLSGEGDCPCRGA